MKSKPVLKFGLPKGSLQEAAIAKMAKAGFKIQVSSRSYVPYVNDPEMVIRLIRAQEISRYVEHGYLDCGITGYDWIQENNSDVHEVGEFQFSKATSQPARWVLAVPEDSKYQKAEDLGGCIIATELVNTTKNYFANKNIPVKVEFSWGATEVKPPILADAIVEVTETGSSLKANRLRIIETISESYTQLIANKNAWQNGDKKRKIENIALMLRGAIDAQGRVGLMLNVRKQDLDKVLKVLPALNSPTVSQLSNQEWVAVNTILEESVVRDVIPKLKAASATGIVEYPLNKLVM